MVFNNGMVKPSSFMISTSGKKANFGVYRTNKSMYIDSAMFSPDKNNPPSYTDIQVSPNINYGEVPVFLKSNSVSRASVAFTIPSDIDTSSPLQFFMDGTAIQAGGGEIVTEIYRARIDSQNPPLAFPLDEINVGDQVTAVSGAANGFVTIVQDLDISEFNADDIMFISFARIADDSSDTYTGDLIIGDITFRYHSKFV